MREAHAHIAAHGQSLAMPSLAGCGSLAECIDTVRGLAAAAPPRAWLRLQSARVESWTEQRWPTLAELDAAAPHTPIVILSFDHHAAVANSAALAAAHLHPGDLVPPNGRVEVDAGSGRATGLLTEHAAYRAWEAAPEPSIDERAAHLDTSLHALAALGFTEVHDLHSQDWLGPALSALERAGRLPAAIRRILLYPPVGRLEDVHSGARAWRSERIRLAGGKLFADGTLNSRTALMLHPYRDPLPDAPRGRAMLSPADLDRGLALTESLGLHLATHAIGDAAVRMLLNAIERTGIPRTPRTPDNRHRIEHAELIDEADIPRFAQLGVVCSVQPCHLLADVEVLHRQLPHRLDRVLPLRDLIDAGCTPGGDDPLLWFGSDVPIVRPDPEDTIQAATQRRRADTPESAAIAISQRLTPSEVQAAFAPAKF